MGTFHDLRGVWRKRQEMAGTDHPGWRLNNLTTTQRDALTGEGAAKAGDVIWNTTTVGAQVYDGSAWQDIGGQSGSAGTVTTPSTTAVVESGDGINHLTKLTMTSFALGTCPDNASLATGNKFYTFPAGAILVTDISWVGSLLATVSVKTATPEFGIGSAIGAGAVSVLSGTGTFEDYMDGNTSGGTNGTTVAPDINGTTFYKFSRNNLGMIIKTSGGLSHDLFMNVAAAWSDVTAAGTIAATGVLTIKWREIN